MNSFEYFVLNIFPSQNGWIWPVACIPIVWIYLATRGGHQDTWSEYYLTGFAPMTIAILEGIIVGIGDNSILSIIFGIIGFILFALIPWAITHTIYEIYGYADYKGYSRISRDMSDKKAIYDEEGNIVGYQDP